MQQFTNVACWSTCPVRPTWFTNNANHTVLATISDNEVGALVVQCAPFHCLGHKHLVVLLLLVFLLLGATGTDGPCH